jgi:hypothetical protein
MIGAATPFMLSRVRLHASINPNPRAIQIHESQIRESQIRESQICESQIHGWPQF